MFFFYGPNTYAARQKIREMREAYIQKNGGDFGIDKLEGAEVDSETLSSSLTAAPFLSRSRLVIIENLGQNKETAGRVSTLLEQIPDTTVAVFYEPQIDQRTAYFRNLSGKAKAVKFDNLVPAKLNAWTKREFERLGTTADAEAIKKLVEITGDDQWRLHMEINKLANYSEKISAKEVEELAVASPTQTIFDLVEAMSSARLKEALSIYRKLLAQQINEHYILTMIIWQLRNLLLAKAAGSLSPEELAKKAGLSPFVASKALAKQNDFSLDTLKQAFQLALETDYQIKSGGGESEVLVERLIYKVAQGLGRPQGLTSS